MKDLILVFTKSKKRLPLGSWLICLLTSKPYSHIAREVHIAGLGTGYYQANEGKTNYEHERFFLKKHEIVKKYSIPITEECEINIRSRCWIDAGAPYGTMQNFGIALVSLCKLFGKKIKNPWKKGKNCSELIYTNVFEPIVPKKYDPDTIKPQDIEHIILTSYAGRYKKLI